MYILLDMYYTAIDLYIEGSIHMGLGTVRENKMNEVSYEEVSLGRFEEQIIFSLNEIILQGKWLVTFREYIKNLICIIFILNNQCHFILTKTFNKM